MISSGQINQQHNRYVIGQSSIPMLGSSSTTSNGTMIPTLDSQTVQHAVENNTYANRIKASSFEEDDSKVTAALTLGSWYVICQGMDKFSAKCAGAYEDTILGKIGAFGDKCQNKFTGTWFGKKCTDMCSSISKGWDKLTGKSKVLYSMTHTPTHAEWNFARAQGGGIKSNVVNEVAAMFEEFLKPITNAQQLEQFGYTPAQIEAFNNTLKGVSKPERATVLLKEELRALGCKQKTIDALFAPHSNKKYKFNFVELKMNGVSDADLARLFPSGYADNARVALTRKDLKSLGINSASVDNMFEQKIVTAAQETSKQLKSKKLGFKSYKDYLRCKKNIYDSIDDISKALEKADDKCCVSIWRKGKVKAHFVGRKVYLSELCNKLRVAVGNGAKTKLGKALTKSIAVVTECFTNRFAGGKIAALLQATFLAGVFLDTFKAPKGDKVKTFAERSINDLSYFFAAPLAYLTMHKFGGMKYAGLDETGVKSYRQALKIHNEKAANMMFASKAEHKASLKALDKMLDAGVKNPFTRLCKRIGRLINIGNETRMAYMSRSSANLNLFRKIPNFLKNCAGAPLRFALVFAVAVPFVASVCVKIAHAIIGRPTKSILDEDVDNETKNEINEATQFANQQQAVQNTSSVQPKVYASPTNLFNMYQQGLMYKDAVNNSAKLAS